MRVHVSLNYHSKSLWKFFLSKSVRVCQKMEAQALFLFLSNIVLERFTRTCSFEVRQEGIYRLLCGLTLHFQDQANVLEDLILMALLLWDLLFL